MRGFENSQDLPRRGSVLRNQVATLYVCVKHDGPGLAPEAVPWIQGLA